jgi:hypothetical protein
MICWEVDFYGKTQGNGVILKKYLSSREGQAKVNKSDQGMNRSNQIKDGLVWGSTEHAEKMRRQ